MESIPRGIQQYRFLRPKRIEGLLKGLANAPGLPPAGTIITDAGKVIVADQDDVTRKIPADQLGARRDFSAMQKRELQQHYRDVFANCSELDIWTWRYLLREAWKSDWRQKEWIVFVLRNFYAQATRLWSAFNDEGRAARVREFQSGRQTWDDAINLRKPTESDPDRFARYLFNYDDAQLAKQAREATLPPAGTMTEEILSYLQSNLDRAFYCKNPECVAPYSFRNRKGQEYCSLKCASWGKRRSNKESARRQRKKGRKT